MSTVRSPLVQQNRSAVHRTWRKRLLRSWAVFQSEGEWGLRQLEGGRKASRQLQLQAHVSCFCYFLLSPRAWPDPTVKL